MSESSLTSWLVTITATIIAVLAPIQPTMLAVGSLIILDWLTGMAASVKRKQSITSYKMRRTIVKMFAYQLAIIFAFVIETYLIQDIPIVKVVAAVITLTETKSFFENFHILTGVNLLSAIIDKLHGKPMNPEEILTSEDHEKK